MFYDYNVIIHCDVLEFDLVSKFQLDTRLDIDKIIIVSSDTKETAYRIDYHNEFKIPVQ